MVGAVSDLFEDLGQVSVVDCPASVIVPAHDDMERIADDMLEVNDPGLSNTLLRDALASGEDSTSLSILVCTEPAVHSHWRDELRSEAHVVLRPLTEVLLEEGPDNGAVRVKELSHGEDAVSHDASLGRRSR